MTQRKYRQYFNARSATISFMIRSLVGRFEELGSVADPPERGAHRNIRTDNVSIADDPSVGQSGISRMTLVVQNPNLWFQQDGPAA
ncbi:hypothetical protein TNCV_3350321 [Trichonephila clavipes]|nr:hypothetical protein TNCV_3350321 [Trichonephila clavipes]